jgi:hypothetical protein
MYSGKIAVPPGGGGIVCINHSLCSWNLRKTYITLKKKIEFYLVKREEIKK